MIDAEKTHEVEMFFLRFKPTEGAKIIAHFQALGSEHEEDFFYRDNPEHERWQAISVWSAECQLNGVAADPANSLIDSLKVTYYFAALPEQNFEHFLKDFTATVQALEAEIRHRSAVVTIDEIRPLFEQWKNDLKQECGEQPGSESLAVLIQDLKFG